MGSKQVVFVVIYLVFAYNLDMYTSRQIWPEFERPWSVNIVNTPFYMEVKLLVSLGLRLRVVYALFWAIVTNCSRCTTVRDKWLEDKRELVMKLWWGLTEVRRKLGTENNRYTHAHRSVPCGTRTHTHTHTVYATCAGMFCAWTSGEASLILSASTGWNRGGSGWWGGWTVRIIKVQLRLQYTAVPREESRKRDQPTRRWTWMVLWGPERGHRNRAFRYCYYYQGVSVVLTHHRRKNFRMVMETSTLFTITVRLSSSSSGQSWRLMKTCHLSQLKVLLKEQVRNCQRE